MTGRGLVGRRIGRLILIATVALDAVAVLLMTSAPGSIGPMFVEPPAASAGPAVIVGGVGLQVLGLAWMIRILRADPEGHASWFRFRRS